MSACSNSAQSGCIVSDDRIRNVLKRHIRKALDLNVFSRATLSAESGVSIHQLDQIMSSDANKQRRVTAEDALCLAYTLGDEAVAALMATIFYQTYRAADAQALEPMLIAATAMEGLSVIAKAAADGRIDHIERPICRDAADLIIATVKPLSSLGERA